MSAIFHKPSAAALADIAARAKIRDVSPLDERASKSTTPRAFSAVEKALIRKLHGYMPAQQLLEVLNERLAGDLGAAAAMHTMAQLHAEIGAAPAAPAGGHDWQSLRKLVAGARRAGVLEAIDRQLIDDFAVVFGLSAGQVLRLHDVLLRSKEDE